MLITRQLMRRRMFPSTPVDKINLFGQDIFVKRDDLIHPHFSGNKARKFAYFLEHEFKGIKKLIGHGSAQANSLYSMSALAKLKGWQLDFYVAHISEQVKQSVVGNYAESIAFGANVVDVSALALSPSLTTIEYIQQQVLPHEPAALFVPEGGRCEYAEFGVSQLGLEIMQWAGAQALPHLYVCLPSGTGTTALFLNKFFVEQGCNIQVITCATVGDEEYLTLQFRQLSPDSTFYPQILPLPKKYHFGKLHSDCYKMWCQVCEQGIEFELLYDPVGFIALRDFLSSKGACDVLYIHQGGVLGNQTMLPRYQRKYS